MTQLLPGGERLPYRNAGWGRRLPALQTFPEKAEMLVRERSPVGGTSQWSRY